MEIVQSCEGAGERELEIETETAQKRPNLDGSMSNIHDDEICHFSFSFSPKNILHNLLVKSEPKTKT